MKIKIQNRLAYLAIIALVLALLPFNPRKASAVQYQFNDASLELSDSNPTSVANWTLTIKTVQEIPLSGKIVITPPATYFDIDDDMD